MNLNFNNEQPIYLQIAQAIENGILNNSYVANSRIPSTTKISATFHINPATVLKGMNMLVRKGLLNKKRGIGMFVSSDAKDKIKNEKKHYFYDRKILNLTKEASELGITCNQLVELIKRGYQNVRHSD